MIPNLGNQVAPNSVSPVLKPKHPCTKRRECRRCNHCMDKWRKHFITEGVAHIKQHTLNSTIAVSTLRPLAITDPWLTLSGLSTACSRLLSGRIGPYIKVLGIEPKKRNKDGTFETPKFGEAFQFVILHIHYILKNDAASIAQRLAAKKIPHVGVGKIIHLQDPENYLGYLFDENAKPTFCDPDRIKGTRCITASRPMRYGFPRTKFNYPWGLE